MECRLASSSEPWTCQISLRWEVSRESGKPLRTIGEAPFGPCITDKANVELMLRRAQTAVLNPKTSTKKFRNMDIETLRAYDNETIFSKNVVCVDISGPDLTDLAFVDLPGKSGASYIILRPLSQTHDLLPTM